MVSNTIEIRPIKPDEWLPDRCLNSTEAFDPHLSHLETGCPGLNYFTSNNRETLEELYRSAISKYGRCGFVAWDKGKVIAYHNFFPQEVANHIKFYGYGFDSHLSDKTLVHNCLTIVKGDYSRNGISSRLVETSIAWAKGRNWKRFEIHLVLPDCEKGWLSDQKSCLSFWKRFGFRIFREYDADDATRKHYGITKRYSMYLQLNQ